MAKIYQILGIVAIIAGAIFFWILHERKSAKNEVIIETQQEKIEVQNEVIKQQTQVFQRKVVNKTFTSDANFEWLRANICQDCKN